MHKSWLETVVGRDATEGKRTQGMRQTSDKLPDKAHRERN